MGSSEDKPHVVRLRHKSPQSNEVPGTRPKPPPVIWALSVRCHSKPCSEGPCLTLFKIIFLDHRALLGRKPIHTEDGLTSLSLLSGVVLPGWGQTEGTLVDAPELSQLMDQPGAACQPDVAA